MVHNQTHQLQGIENLAVMMLHNKFLEGNCLVSNFARSHAFINLSKVSSSSSSSFSLPDYFNTISFIIFPNHFLNQAPPMSYLLHTLNIGYKTTTTTK